MNLKDYMKAKKLREASNKLYEVKIAKRGEGRKHGSTKRQRKNHNNDSQRN